MFLDGFAQKSSVYFSTFLTKKKILRFLCITCCCQSFTFERNLLILSMFVKRFSLQPCSLVFKVEKCQPYMLTLPTNHHLPVVMPLLVVHHSKIQ